MKIKFDINKEQLNNFLKKQKHTQFLQSFDWGELQVENGSVIKRLAVEKDGKILAVATLVKKKIGLGKNYFYCPRGPVFDEFRMKDVDEYLFTEIEKISKKDNIIFLRFEPKFKIQSASWRTKIIKTIDLQPKKTLMLDLGESEENLLKSMHQKTRYNLRLAKKKGVEIVKGKIEDFDNFWELMNTTSERDDFRIHSKNHYKKLLELDFVKLYFAKFENNIIAAGLFSFFGDTVTYMHGASSNEYRNLMSPFLLQWEVAKLAQKENYKYYDFYGIDEKKWPGVTRFKKGFGGFEVEYPGTLDMVFDGVWYNAYKAIRILRRKVKF